MMKSKKLVPAAAQAGNYAASDTGQRPAPKAQDIVKAETELTGEHANSRRISREAMEKYAEDGLRGVRRAAIAASHRMAALEPDADAIHARTLLSCTARVVSTKEGGLHALLTDDNGVTIEISGGELAAAISKD